MQGSFALNIGLRAFQFLMAFLAMVLIANMIAGGRGPAVINYDLFASLFALVSLFYLIASTVWESLGFPPVLLGLDIANTIWTFIAGTATAARLGSHSCRNEAYLISNSVTRGSTKRCNQSKASVVFFFLAFFAFLVSTVLTAFGSRGRLQRSGRPTMSQVTV